MNKSTGRLNHRRGFDIYPFVPVQVLQGCQNNINRETITKGLMIKSKFSSEFLVPLLREQKGDANITPAVRSYTGHILKQLLVTVMQESPIGRATRTDRTALMQVLEVQVNTYSAFFMDERGL